MILKAKFSLFLLFLSISTFSQVEHEINPPENIKSIIFRGTNDGDQFPIIKLGQTIFLTFDDLYADEEDYYYKIEHFNYDWTPSNLKKSQYLNGLDNLRIQNYQNSITTIQPYSNYQLKLPNKQTKLKVSGNYTLKIYDRYEKLVFSRRFIVYKDMVAVGVVLKRARNLNVINEKQTVQFTINANDVQLVNPQQEVKVTILQNYNWDTAIMNIKPQFFAGNQLIYKYDTETQFDGGNEYLFFDTKEIRVNNNAIARVRLEEVYNHYLFTNINRSDRAYTYNPDINGNFIIRTLDGIDSSPYIEADYSYVHFRIPYDEIIGLDNIYVYGKFNNYDLNDENKLQFNPDTGAIEGKVLLKQGFYNYKYIKTTDKGEIDYNFISGNHYETENDYLVLVYYRNFGNLYDSIIGIGSGNSTNISN